MLLSADRWKTEIHNDLSLIQHSYLITICPIELQLICFIISEDAPIFILNILFRINQSVTMSLCYYAVASQENMGATYCCCCFQHIVFIMVFWLAEMFGWSAAWNPLKGFIPSLPYFLSALLWSFLSSSFSFYTTNFKRGKPALSGPCLIIILMIHVIIIMPQNTTWICVVLWYSSSFLNQDAKTYSKCFVKAELVDQLKVLNPVINNTSAVT